MIKIYISEKNAMCFKRFTKTNLFSSQQPCEVGTIIVCVCVKSLQLCPTLCDPMNSSLSVSSVHGISQARILEPVAISFSKGSSQLRGRNCVSCITGGFFTTKPPGKPRGSDLRLLCLSWIFFPVFWEFFSVLVSHFCREMG